MVFQELPQQTQQFVQDQEEDQYENENDMNIMYESAIENIDSNEAEIQPDYQEQLRDQASPETEQRQELATDAVEMNGYMQKMMPNQ